MAYKLTRGSVSVIRTDAAGIEQAEAAGFILAGECDQDGNPVVPRPAPKPKGKQPTDKG